MKKLILFLGVILMGYTVQAQQYQTVSNTEKTHLVELEDGLYRVIIKCDEGKLRQLGYYKEKIDGGLVRNGIWKMYDDNEKLITKAEFEDGRLVWIRAGGKKYTADEIELHRLRSRVVTLERQLISMAN